nr:hypothetical protein [uncultured bacterium]
MSLAAQPSWFSLLRRLFSIVFALVACGLMGVSAYFFRPGVEGLFLSEGALSLLLGGLALGIALVLAKDKHKLQTLTPWVTPLKPKAMRWWAVGMVGVGIVLLALVAEISGQALHIPELEDVSVHLQFALLVLGILLVGWGLGGGTRLRFSISDWRTAFWLVLIFAFGLGIRMWGLDTSARFMQDETVFTDALRFFWDGRHPGLMNGGGAYTVTLIYPYWNALTVTLWGRNLVGLRMASVLLGVWVIPVAYELTRTLFDKRAGLIAALFAATFPPIIHFSQISWGHMGDALFGLMTLMFVARALKWNRRVDWAFAGVSLGLTQYFYEVGRLLYPPLIIGWFVLLVIGWRMKRFRRGFVLTAIAAVLVAAPVYYAIVVRDAPATPRINDSATRLEYWQGILADGVTDDERFQLTGRLTTPFLVYVQHPDSMAEYYGGFEGLVIPPLVPLFFLGVCWIFWRLRYPVAVLLIGLLLVSTANIFANDPGFASRYVAFASLIPIVLAIGLYSVLTLLSLNRRWLLTGLVVLIALGQLYFYFDIHLPYYNIQRRRASPEHDLFDAVLRAASLPADTQVFLIDRAPFLDYGRANGLYLFMGEHPYEIKAPTSAEFDPNELPRDRSYAFFIAPDDTEAMDKIRLAFPNVSPPMYTTESIPVWDEYILLLTKAGD